MHRVVRPGGFFLLSTQGYMHIIRLAAAKRYPLEVLRAAFDGMQSDGFYFHRFYATDRNSKGLSSANWGLTFMTPAWLQEHLAADGWELRDTVFGAWGSKQDVHVLQRRAGSPKRQRTSSSVKEQATAVPSAAPKQGRPEFPAGQQLFVVLATQRTGSNMLVNALGTHPDIRCHGELMRRNVPDLRGALQIVKQLPEEFASEEYRHAHPYDYVATVFGLDRAAAFQGFKLMLRDNVPFRKQLIADPRFKKILLYRDNALAAYSSHKIARVTGQGIAGRFAEVKTAQVPFKEKEFERFMKNRKEAYKNTEKELKSGNVDFLKVEYTDMSSNYYFDNVLDFLDARPGISLIVHTQKRNTNNILDRFTNPERVIQYLKENNLENWSVEAA